MLIECKWCKSSLVQGGGPKSHPEWDRWKCKGCGSFGYVKNPNSAELSDIYKSAWSEPANSGAFATGSTDEGIANSLLKAVQFPATDICNVTCLDFGGGSGYFAKVLSEHGVNLTVYEPYGESLAMANNVRWVKEQKEIPRDAFDWIFMIEVVEHLLDPVEDLRKIFSYLAPGGKLVITTPNAKGWRAKLSGFDWREVQNPTHINLFSQSSLVPELRKLGFVNVKRLHRPVRYRQSGVKSVALSITQMLGVDGGLRCIAEKPS